MSCFRGVVEILYEVQKLVGHSSSNMTEIYSGLQPEQIHRAVNRREMPLNCGFREVWIPGTCPDARRGNDSTIILLLGQNPFVDNDPAVEYV